MLSTRISILAIQINNVVFDWGEIGTGALYFIVAVGIIFALLLLATSILRFQHIISIENHGEDLKPEDAFVIRMAGRISAIRNRPAPFWLVLMAVRALAKEEGGAVGSLNVPDLVDSLHSALRSSDEVSISQNGEVAFLLETPRTEIAMVQERLRKRIDELEPVDEDGNAVVLDFRFGCVSFPEKGEKVEQLFSSAREALARAQESSEHGCWEFDPPLEELAPEEQDEESGDEEQTSVPAYIDPTTGLLKSSRSRSTAQKFLSQFRRDGDRASIMIMKVDDLKRLQQDYGEGVMDSVRVAISAVLQKNLRDDDLIACWGEDAFLVGLEADSKGVSEAARRLIAIMRKTRVEHESYRLRFSISAGTATYPVNGRLPREILAAAETAQREAHDMGRNVFAAFEPKMLKRRQRDDRSSGEF